LVPKALVIPLQRVARRTGRRRPCGYPPPLGGQRHGARRRFHSDSRNCRASSPTRLARVARLAFTTLLTAFLIGSRLRYAPLQRHTGSRGPNRWGRPEGRVPAAGLLSWRSSMPLHRHDRRLRPLPPGPSPRLRRRTARSLARSVLVVPPDFDGFLRRASIRRPRPRRPAGLLHPAAGHGVRQVSGLLYGFWPPADLVGPLFEAFPTGVDPSKLFPLQQPSTRHRPAPH